jgi:hypothetical protein
MPRSSWAQFRMRERFLARRIVDSLCVFSRAEYSDSPRLHFLPSHFFMVISTGTISGAPFTRANCFMQMQLSRAVDLAAPNMLESLVTISRAYHAITLVTEQPREQFAASLIVVGYEDYSVSAIFRSRHTPPENLANSAGCQ